MNRCATRISRYQQNCALSNFYLRHHAVFLLELFFTLDWSYIKYQQFRWDLFSVKQSNGILIRPNIFETVIFSYRNFQTLEKSRFTPMDFQTNKKISLILFILPIHINFQFLVLLCHQQLKYPVHLNFLLFRPLHNFS